jgi:hypothetical protein
VHKKIANQYGILGFYTNFYSEAEKSISGQQLPQNLTFFLLEAILGTKTK